MKISSPNFLSATSPELLRESMLEACIKMHADIRFFDIQYDGKRWVCWFYQETDLSKIIGKKPVGQK